MPRNPSQPRYRYHKARDCAVVTLAGKNYYLGPYDSPESHERYARLIAEWRRHGGRVRPAAENAAGGPSVGELILRYWGHVQTYYLKDGRPTSEQDNIRQALRFVRRLYGSSPAAAFGPRALKNVRDEMIAAGRCRNLINKDIHRVRGMFRWAVEEELLPASVHRRLTRVRGLRKGRSAARETPPVGPVPVERVEAVLPHLPPPVAAMVRLQLLTAARAQEVAALRPCDVTDVGDGVWHYLPPGHKTAHLDRAKVIVLGPQAQAVLRPWLDRDPAAYCFSPAEAAAWNRARQRKKATTADDAVKPKNTQKRAPGAKYTRHSYRTCVQRACRRAGVPVWSPRQLRHSGATLVRARFGLEAAKAVLGHAETKVTEIYAERDLELAARVMREVG